MTQKDLNEIHDLAEDVRVSVKKLSNTADPYTRMKRNEQSWLIGRTLDCIDILTRYLLMVTAQREDWEPAHPTDELEYKVKFCLELAGRRN